MEAEPPMRDIGRDDVARRVCERRRREDDGSDRKRGSDDIRGSNTRADYGAGNIAGSYDRSTCNGSAYGGAHGGAHGSTDDGSAYNSRRENNGGRNGFL